MSEALPPGWVGVPLGSLADIEMGQAPPGSACNHDGKGTPFVKAGEFGPERPIIREWTTQPLKFARESDVLICVVGATAGKLNLGTDCAIGRSAAAIRPKPALDQHFLYRYMTTLVERLRFGSTGSAQGVISKPVLEKIDVPLPPLPEQRRIVAKLDQLSARSRAARHHLARTATLAARAKQAILTAAFRGDLTAEWREAHGETLAPTTVGAVADASSGYGFPKDRQGKKAGRYPFAKVSDISRAVATSSGQLTSAENFVDDEDLHTLRARPVPAGSTVFAKIGEALKLNRRAVVRQATILDNNCMALTPRLDRIAPEYLYLFMQTIDLAPFSVATTVPSVRRGDVDSIRLDLPSLNEQREIVQRIETAFARIDRLAAEAARAARLLDRLDERLLARAFRGELVPQDSADEPAAHLLARLRAARADAPKARRGRKAKA